MSCLSQERNPREGSLYLVSARLSSQLVAVHYNDTGHCIVQTGFTKVCEHSFVFSGFE